MSVCEISMICLLLLLRVEHPTHRSCHTAWELAIHHTLYRTNLNERSADYENTAAVSTGRKS